MLFIFIAHRISLVWWLWWCVYLFFFNVVEYTSHRSERVTWNHEEIYRGDLFDSHGNWQIQQYVTWDNPLILCFHWLILLDSLNRHLIVTSPALRVTDWSVIYLKPTRVHPLSLYTCTILCNHLRSIDIVLHSSVMMVMTICRSSLSQRHICLLF